MSQDASVQVLQFSPFSGEQTHVLIVPRRERQVVYNQGAIYKQIDCTNVRQALRENTHLEDCETSCTLLICCVCTLVNESFEAQILLGISFIQLLNCLDIHKMSM